MRIGINCGHTVSGTKGCGAVGYIDESVETRRVGIKLETLLSKAGHKVYDCTDDYAPSASANLSKIVAMANKQPLDLFVSIHFNKHKGQAHGTEVHTYGGVNHAEAVSVCNALEKLGFTNRGIKDGSGLSVLRRSEAKAILVEVCFVDNKTDTELYKKIGADAVAQAICEAITGQETTESEGLTMGQYEELKKEIAELRAETHKANNANGGTMIYNYIDKNMPSWAHEAVQWLVDKGILAGTGEGLNLSEIKLWTCVMLYRVIKFVTRK